MSLREIAPSSPFKIVADIQAPPQALLRNAALKLSSTVGEACQVGVPVAAVTLDDAGLPEGPAAIGGSHRLTLGFASDPAAETYPTPRRVVDLDLAVGGQARCLSVPATPLGSSP